MGLNTTKMVAGFMVSHMVGGMVRLMGGERA
eukprot:CAMPEP_0182563312 /NCGR_PEP_ID=MMETSP1324-20130603/5481_1 /TAXON_ID=236786 /ORGANISM="Florenciella sp., Strain RCC1587" /LENGTH=30 /DNA_ID= /DNA_START= /DNA_END= /DNA_ORIENTATION=